MNGSRHRATHTRRASREGGGRGQRCSWKPSNTDTNEYQRVRKRQRRFSAASPVNAFSLHFWLAVL